jgi:phosphoglucosamine mutase
MANGKLFGTDGVRGPVGGVLTAELALELGRAATADTQTERPQVLITRDTRESGPMLESALAAGVADAGGDAFIGGVLPTPAASILVRRHEFDLGAVVSASHNAWGDNGIKFFGRAGEKLGDDEEQRIEAWIAEPPTMAEGRVGRIRELSGALEDYLRELSTTFSCDLQGRKVLLDCANGAAYSAAPAAFKRLGATVEVTAAEPDGQNINEGCGSTHIEHLVECLRRSEAEVGFAFDGDADRVLAVDSNGTVRDGDELIALAALHLKETGELQGGVAVTVMTNHGFHLAMESAGIEVATTDVGDRHVIEELARRGWTLGGEQSGHLIWSEFASTGDGIAAALLAMRALGERDLGDVQPFEKLPQRLEGVAVADRGAIEGASGLWREVEREHAALEGAGRVLVRPSGTEPLLRLMVEAPSEDECAAVLGRLVAVAKRELG